MVIPYLNALINDFNPRSREGSDNGNNDPYDDYMISIHAPAKGATTEKLERLT